MSPPDTPKTELTKVESRYRLLAENPGFGVFLMGPSGECLFINSKVEELTGYTAGELYGMRRFGFLITHPDDHAVGMRAFRRALLGRPSQHLEFRLLHRNGSYRWTSAACFPVRGDDGRVHSIQVVLQDISDLKQAEEELAREYRIRDAETAVRLQIATMKRRADLVGVVACIGEQLSDLGLEHDSCSIQIVNTQGTDFVSCDGRDEVGHVSRRYEVLRSLSWEPVSDNVRLFPWICQVWRSGRSRYVPCTDDSSSLPPGMSLLDAAFSHGTLAVNRRAIDAFSGQDIDLVERFARLLTEGFPRFVDIVEHDRLEEQLRQSQKMEAVGQMIAGVSHNFNNMLTIVLGNLELARPLAAGDLLEYIDEAVDASQRAADLIRELMQFSRRNEEQMEPSDLASVVRDAVHFFQRTLDGRIHLHFVQAQQVPPVLGNRSLLQQIVVNLCLNARDAVEAAHTASPRIDVELDGVALEGVIVPAHVLDPPARCVRLRVRDNGIGMDEVTRLRVFEPFFTTKGVGKGTGLGLTTVYGIVRDHGGWIDVDSRLGQGTEFTVFLPSVEGEAADRSPAPAVTGAGGGETILLVEDERGVRRVVRAILERAGYRVVDAPDGETALQQVRNLGSTISLVLLDLSMPVMSGRAVLQHLARLAPELRVIIFTGQQAGSEQFPGVSAVLTKPANRQQLLDAVGRALDTP